MRDEFLDRLFFGDVYAVRKRGEWYWTGKGYCDWCGDARPYTSMSEAEEKASEDQECEVVRLKVEAKSICGSSPEISKVYENVRRFIEKHHHTNGGMAMIKLIASLFNGHDWRFSIRETSDPLDRTRLEWWKAIVLEYLDMGETEELLELGRFALKFLKKSS